MPKKVKNSSTFEPQAAPLIEANTETATDKIRSQGLNNGELLGNIFLSTHRRNYKQQKTLFTI